MTIKQFDTYRFSISTEVLLHEWVAVTEVDFEKRKIGVASGYYLDCTEFKGIRDNNLLPKGDK